MKRVLLFALLVAPPAWAQGVTHTYGAPVQLRDGSGNAVGTAANPLNVTGGSGGGGGTVTQGTAGTAGSAWYVQPGTNATFPISAGALPLPSGAAIAANQLPATPGTPYVGNVLPATQPGFAIPLTSIPLSTLGATGTTVTINTAGMGSLALYAKFANGASGTLSFFASSDGGTTYVPFAPMTAASQTSGVEPTTVTASSNLRFNVAHYTQIQIQLTTAGSGTATIQGNATQDVDTPEIRSTIAKPVYNQPVVGGAVVSATNPQPTVETSTAGTGITIPTGGTGVIGWLSGIYKAVTGTLTVGGTVTANQGTANASAYWGVIQPFQPIPYPATTTQNTFTTSATASTFTTLAAANTARHGGVLTYYGTGTVYVYFGTAATPSTTNAIRMGPGYTQSVPLDTVPGLVSTDQISVASTVASDTIVVVMQ